MSRPAPRAFRAPRASRRAPGRTDRHERRLIRDFLPPEGVPLKFEVASLGARLGAQVVDLLATGVFALAVVVLLAATDAVAPPVVELIGWLLFLFVRAPITSRPSCSGTVRRSASARGACASSAPTAARCGPMASPFATS